ncbi:DUF6875 domain-containing protein [Saccharothrix australiensis]|uniref:DUF6875 domain-containing protein n=1 Tax=Saccharothrix australiensis TaxID=2072 RepID=UPI000EB34E61|nr:hypothetical protein [Saccharothrix australiensis]
MHSVDRWVEEYLTKPHPGIGRAGAVCPFVGPARSAGTLVVQRWPVRPDAGEAELTAVIREMTEAFHAHRWTTDNQVLHTLVVILDGLTDWPALDRVQAAAKTELVKQGLMLGQFHPLCDERAARNPGFPVSCSPIPLLALRHMAYHDILFLHEDPEWFTEYRTRFGDRYDPEHRVDPLFAALYAEAAARWP